MQLCGTFERYPAFIAPISVETENFDKKVIDGLPLGRSELVPFIGKMSIANLLFRSIITVNIL